MKFHFRTQQGIENLTDAEAEAVVGKDRDSHSAICTKPSSTGDFPRWTFSIQVMTEGRREHVATTRST